MIAMAGAAMGAHSPRLFDPPAYRGLSAMSFRPSAGPVWFATSTVSGPVLTVFGVYASIVERYVSVSSTSDSDDPSAASYVGGRVDDYHFDRSIPDVPTEGEP